jgi:hypothetical protein
VVPWVSMGNFPGGGGTSQPKYYSSKEANNILGDETWQRLKQLEKHARGGKVDYQLFSRILYRRYERMVGPDIEGCFMHCGGRDYRNYDTMTL